MDFVTAALANQCITQFSSYKALDLISHLNMEVASSLVFQLLPCLFTVYFQNIIQVIFARQLCLKLSFLRVKAQVLIMEYKALYNDLPTAPLLTTPPHSSRHQTPVTFWSHHLALLVHSTKVHWTILTGLPTNSSCFFCFKCSAPHYSYLVPSFLPSLLKCHRISEAPSTIPYYSSFIFHVSS